MLTKATAKYQRVSPRKARLIANEVRGKNVDVALVALKHTPNKAAGIIYKVIKSAMANASENQEFYDVSKLIIEEIRVDIGPAHKRYSPRAYGRASLIRKPTSHVAVVLTSKEGN